MKLLASILAVSAACRNAAASPITNAQVVLSTAEQASLPPSKLHGRFLHISDLHPDPFYKLHTSTEESKACHRGDGPAGTYGAETSDCDSPLALVNATFQWIAENLRDEIDFVIWTGDSARHDNDEDIPRTKNQVIELNQYVAGKFAEVFGNGNDAADPTMDLTIPIIPTFGNNDILPHNILLAGPNKWLNTYTSIWRKFIPEAQRHSFERGGWFYVEVIPGKLAVFSLNTLYFFDNNAAVYGCANPSEPGYEHMEWLRIQLQFMRDRGMKAILMGHVPPARTDGKQLWDETCWQRYTLWLQQFRDVVISGLFGHMNVDHFLVHNTKDIDLTVMSNGDAEIARELLDDEFTIESAAEYLEELRDLWSKIPDPATAAKPLFSDQPESEAAGKKKDKKKKDKKKKDKKNKKDKDKKKLGPWGENYIISLVSPSVVPNYFPTLRVVEYNISGLEDVAIWRDTPSSVFEEVASYEDDVVNDAAGKKKPKKPKNPKDPGIVIPSPPASTAPPGPAYSPQPLSLTGYTQYFANLTYINNDVHNGDDDDDDNNEKKDAQGLDDDNVDGTKWREGKHKGKTPKKNKPRPRPFAYEVEYSTFNDSLYGMPDMTVLSYLDLAHRIGQYKAQSLSKDDEIDRDGETIDSISSDGDAESISVSMDDDSSVSDILNTDEGDDLENEEDQDQDKDHSISTEGKKKKDKKKKKKDRKKKKKKQSKKNRVWLAFVQRAFVGTLDEDELESYGF